MNQSQEIDKLAQALIKVQDSLEHVAKDKENPYFKSKYATLNAVWDEAKKQMQANGLCIAQYGDVKDGVPVLVTKLIHESGQWIEGGIQLVYGKEKDGTDNPQKISSAITYTRRYGLSAMLGICSEIDDDGNKASTTNTSAPAASGEFDAKTYHHNENYEFKKGKYEGKKVSELPIDYLEWAIKNADGWMYQMACAEKTRRSLVDIPL